MYQTFVHVTDALRMDFFDLSSMHREKIHMNKFGPGLKKENFIKVSIFIVKKCKCKR